MVRTLAPLAPILTQAAGLRAITVAARTVAKCSLDASKRARAAAVHVYGFAAINFRIRRKRGASRGIDSSHCLEVDAVGDDVAA